MPLEPGTAAPDFTLPSDTRAPVSLSDTAGAIRVLVFMPFPFTTTCEGEACTIRDRWAALDALDAEVLMITCDTAASNRAWSEANSLPFPILSDFWPHGEITRRYECFDERIGVPSRVTYVIDGSGVVTHVFTSASLGAAREFDAYLDAVESLR